MNSKSGLKLVVQSQEYFYELVKEALQSQKTSVQPETEFYLVNLLSHFMTVDNLYSRDAQGNVCEEPLVLMVKEALETPHPEAQRNLFRHVGDVSLYTAGFFQDSLNRKRVDLDYYIEMGETAYQQVASRMSEDQVRAVFEELARRFAACVDILAEVSDKTTQKTEKNLLRLYELWLRTRSQRAARSLQEAGIIPTDSINMKKKNLQ